MHRLCKGSALFVFGVVFLSASLAWAKPEGCATAQDWRDPLLLYGDELVFSVLREGEPIGVHRVTFTPEGDRLVVESRFEAKVKVLFITAYEYLYRSRDVWRDGCLIELSASTDDNGQRTRVDARRDNGRLTIEGPAGVTQGVAGLFPTNHWHPGVVKSDRVLNTITGRVAAVDIADAGESQVSINGAPHVARRYVYTGDIQTEVWYDRDGRWVKMRFRADDGSTIEYVCRKCRAEAPPGRA